MDHLGQYTIALGQRLHHERSKRRWSLDKLASISGLGRRTLREAELGRMSLRTFVTVTKALDLMPSALLVDLDRGSAGQLPGTERTTDGQLETRRKVTERTFELHFEDGELPVGPYHVGAVGDVPQLNDTVETPDGREYQVVARALKLELATPKRRGVAFEPLALRFVICLQGPVTDLMPQHNP